MALSQEERNHARIESMLAKAVEKYPELGTHGKYKIIRAVFYQACLDAIANKSLNDMFKRALKNVDNLPRGWRLYTKTRDPKRKTVKKSEAPIVGEQIPLFEDGTKAKPRRRTTSRR